MRLYSELAPWFHLLTHPSDYEDEADHIVRVVDATIEGRAETLLELGSGGGNNASHLKQRFACTLTDISPEMLELSKTVNPECEHLQGDMRTLRLGSVFDVVFVHDAIAYRYLEWDHDPDPADTTYDVELVVVLVEEGKELRVVHDHHTCGVFPEAAWHRLIARAGLDLVEVETVFDPHAGEHAVFVARKRA